jgi:hypothetical protein
MSTKDPNDFSEPPFDVYIEAEDETVTFESYEVLADWAENQSELWEPARALSSHETSVTQQAWQNLHNFFTGLRSLATSAVHPDTNTSQNARNGIPDDPAAAAARLVWATRDRLNSAQPLTPEFLTKIVEVGIEDQAGQTEPRVHKARLTRLHKEWNDTFRDTQTEGRRRLGQGIRLGAAALRRVNAARRDHEKAIHDHKDEMYRIESTFKERMRLQAPATYWTGRAKMQTAISCAAFVGFTAIGVSAAYGLWSNWAGILVLVAASSSGTTATAGTDFNLLPAAMLTVPAILLLWLLRLVSRIFTSALGSARDAALRGTLIQTYLSLMGEPDAGMQEPDRLLILQALFRPEHSGSDDDAPPPNLLEIIRNATSPR